MEKKVLTQVSPVVLPWRVKILYAAGSFSKALLCFVGVGSLHAVFLHRCLRY